MVNTGGITASTGGISPEQSTVYARRSRGRAAPFQEGD